MSKSKFLGIALATFVAASLTACDSGYVEETRKPNDYIADWNMAEQRYGVKAIIPKSYKSEKPNTQPPFVILMEQGKQSGIAFEARRFDEIKSFTINGGKCESGKIESGAKAQIKCDANSVSKIEIDTIAGKFTYKFK